MSQRFLSAVAALGLAASMGVAPAATVFETTDLVASTPTAAAQLPPAIEFSVAAGATGNYVAQLRDLNLPARFDSLTAIVTHDLQVVAKLAIASGATQAQSSFPAVAGAYRIHVLGKLPASQQEGAFAVSVTPQAGGTPLVETAGAITGDASAPPASELLQAQFDIAAAGTYQVTITDHAFPAALAAAPQVALLRNTGSGFENVQLNAGAFTVAPDKTGAYELEVFATAAGPDEAGLFSARVSGGPSSVVVHQSTNRVGRLPAPIDVSLPSTGQYSLTIADAVFPSPLTTLAALVAQDSAVLGQRSHAGSFPITGTQGTVQVFTFAKTTMVGAFSVRLSQGATRIFGDVRAVDASPAADTPAIYSFEPSAPIAAGNYRLTVNDFRFPSALPALHAAVIQGDSIVDSTDTPGALDVTLASGTVKTLVAVEPPAGTPSQPNRGLFGIDLSVVQGVNVFESTQGVGGLFKSYVAQIPTTGRYDFTVADLEFPEALSSSALAITRGTDLVAQMFGGSSVTRQVDAGTYVLNFIGQPAAGQVHGTYGLKVADTPPAPTVTLTANPGTVTSGARTTLQWNAAGATACTAANGWSGSKTTSGTEQSAALTSNATFELSCSGPGGTTNASASVVVNTAASGGGEGGGGSSGFPLLIYMSSLLCVRFMIMSRRRNAFVTQTH